MSRTHSRFRQLMLMLPFFLIGIALPVYFYGFSGDGPPSLQTQSYSPVPPPAETAPAPSSDRSTSTDPLASSPGRPSMVYFVRGVFDSFVDKYVSDSLTPATIKIGAFFVVFTAVFALIRTVLFLSSSLGGALTFLIHKAAAPMFMGFLAVGSTWGIHQTVAQEFGMNWAAATVTLTAAVASLFALAGVKIR